MRNFGEKLIPLGFTFLLAVSFLNLDATKYDTADRIWLSLLLGVLILISPLLLRFEGIRKYPLVSLTLAVFCVSVWISWIFSQTKNYGFTEAVVYSAVALFGISLTTVKEKTLEKLLTIAVIFALASALFGFWYFPTHGEARMAGLFLDAKDPRHFFPNAFANFLLMAWPVVVKKQVSGIRYQVLTALLLSILLAALYLTYSRGAWAVFAVQIILLLIFAWRQIWKIILASALAALVFIMLLTNLRLKNFSNISVSEKISFQNIEQRTSLEERKDFWIGSLKLIAQEPLKGFGPMSFRYAYPQVQQKFLGLSDHPHNWLLKIGVENGIPALLFFIAFLTLVFRHAFSTSSNIPYSIFHILAFLGGLLHNFIDYNMNFIPTIALFFLLAAALLGKKQETHRPRLSNLSLIIWMLIASGVTVASIHAIQNKNAYIPRDYFRNEAKNYDLHLSKNPLDAHAWYLKGDAARALELDPMNELRYYRKVLEETGNRKQETGRVRKVLQEYEGLLAHNVHYTAFTDNPEEAAKIYEIFGERKKAQEIRQKAAEIKKAFAEKQHFGKQLAPRTFW